MTAEEAKATAPWSCLAALWRGELPLAKAFWEYALGYGTLLCIFTTGATFAALSAGFSMIVVGALFVLPLPYNVAAVVGVWRSAARYEGAKFWADGARIMVVGWALLASVV